MTNRRHESALKQAERHIKYTRERLVHHAEMVSDKLCRMAAQLKADPDYTFNSLGELQASGPELDRLCGVLDSEKSALELLKYALEKENSLDD